MSTLLIGLILLGCSDRMTGPQSSRPDGPFEKGIKSFAKKDANPEVINDALERLAMALARTLTEKNVRVKLKEEVGKKFDGDYNVLFKHIGDYRFSDGKTLRQRIANGYGESRSKVGEKVGDEAALIAVNAFVSKIPRFHIAVPVNYSKWDPHSYTPLVAYVPFGIDDQQIEKLKAFDSEGNLYWLNGKRAPETPVVVLGINERTDNNGNLTIMLAPVEDGGGGGGGGGTYGWDLLTLGQFNCKNNDWDGWFGDAPEFYTAVTYYQGGSITHTDCSDVTEEQNYVLHRTVYSMITGTYIHAVSEVRIMERDGGLGGSDDHVDTWQGIEVPGFEVWFYGTNADISLYWRTNQP